MLLTPPILFLVVITYIYKFDDTLRSEALEVLNSTPEQIDIANNGYYALLGMFVSEGEDPHSAGIEIVEKVK